jgi:doubled CXXCH motif protein
MLTGNLIRAIRGITLIVLAHTLANFPTPDYANATQISGDQGTCSFSLQLRDTAQRNRFIALLARITTEHGETKETAQDETSSIDSEVPMQTAMDARMQRNSNDRLDIFSYGCLTCHDGVSGSAVNVNVPGTPGESRPGARFLTSNHPIGMNYAGYTRAGGKFKEIAPFDGKILLTDGRVGCLSCHNPLNPEKSHLAVSDVRSGLCLSCHIK